MSKRKLLIIAICCLSVVLLATVGILLLTEYWLPYSRATSSLPKDANIILYEQTDGRTLVTWPESSNAQQYLLEIIDPLTGVAEYSVYLTQTSHLIDPLPDDERRTLRISPVVEYTVPFEEQPRMRIGENVLEVTDYLSAPKITDIHWEPLPNTDQVSVRLEMTPGAVGRMYQITESGRIEPAATLNGGKITLSFGEGKGLPIPADGQALQFTFDAFRAGDGYVFHGLYSESKRLIREDLLDTHLVLNIRDLGMNTYLLSWNETAGRVYELQCRVAGAEQWQTMTTNTYANRTYTTERLAAMVKMEYRVICTDIVPGLESPVITMRTGGSLLYSTVWPIKNLTVYEGANRATAIGAVTRATAHCVLGLENGMFKIRFADSYGYIDSHYCMINLVDYFGDHCLYNITNSYSSLYRAHEYDIPEVTGSLVTGYEHVMLGENTYLVPFLYPAAVKLENAIEIAGDMGYKLLIYDSFRPQSATNALHDLAYSFSQTMVPIPEPDPNLPEEDLPTVPTEPMTFGQYMTDNYRYTLSNFIAKGRSRHNLGVALDLTLVAMDPTMTPTLPLPDGEDPPVDPETPETPEIPVDPDDPDAPEIPVDPDDPDAPVEPEPPVLIGPDGELVMQTPMHDLTWYSERQQNGLTGQILAYIMESAGFAGIDSEWWHFQDNETYDAYNPPALMEGVSAQGWVTDDGIQWRYRDITGNFLIDCTEIIEGELYAFDANGIATWLEFPLEEEGDQNDQIA